MPKFMLLFRNEGVDFYSLAPEQTQKIVNDFERWYGSLVQAGKFVTKGRLKDGEGRTLRARNGRITVDGPYAETKEAVGGFFMIEAVDYEEAVGEARKCPLLQHGASVEVRQLKFTDEFPCQL